MLSNPFKLFLVPESFIQESAYHRHWNNTETEWASVNRAVTFLYDAFFCCSSCSVYLLFSPSTPSFISVTLLGFLYTQLSQVIVSGQEAACSQGSLCSVRASQSSLFYIAFYMLNHRIINFLEYFLFFDNFTQLNYVMKYDYLHSSFACSTFP